MSDPHERYTSLSDLFTVTARRARLILGFTVLCASAAYAYSTTRPTTFTAEAAVSYTDPSQDLSILGGGAARSVEPDQLAATKANTITRPELLKQLRQRTGLRLSADQLTERFAASVEATSNLVVVRATAPTGREAARLANGLAETSVASEGQTARRRYSTAADGIRRRLGQLGSSTRDSATRFALQDQLTRLESLSALAQPASVAKTAQVPTSPSSPKPLRSGALAGFFGLFLGFSSAFVRESLDRRVHGPVDIEGLGLPVLASVAESAMGKVAHVDGTHRSGDAAVVDSIRVLRTSLTLLDPEPQVVAVTSAMPQEGKSTVSAALAYANAASSRNTLLLECDLRRPALGARLGISLSPGLSDYLVGGATLEQVQQTVPVADRKHARSDNPNPGVRPDPTAVAARWLTCIVAGSPMDYPTELLADEAFVSLLVELRTRFAVIVIDTCPLLSVADTIQLIPNVDGVVLCVRAEQTTREQALAGRALLDRVSKDKPVGVVATGVADRQRAAYGYYGYGPRG